MSGFQLNLAPLKEPLGFIKVLEWVFSIFSFATCGGYSGDTSLYVSCTNVTFKGNETLTASFGYPFRLNTVLFKGVEKLCDRPWNPVHLTGDYSSPAQFYVTIAVLAFLYSLGALVFYIGYRHLFQDSKVPLIDFIITVIFAFMWLVSSSAWAKGLTDVKYVTEYATVAKYNFNCTDNYYKCLSGDQPHMDH